MLKRKPNLGWGSNKEIHVVRGNSCQLFQLVLEWSMFTVLAMCGQCVWLGGSRKFLMSNIKMAMESAKEHNRSISHAKRSKQEEQSSESIRVLVHSCSSTFAVYCVFTFTFVLVHVLILLESSTNFRAFLFHSLMFFSLHLNTAFCWDFNSSVTGQLNNWLTDGRMGRWTHSLKEMRERI